jgi:hypothetical protein
MLCCLARTLVCSLSIDQEKISICSHQNGCFFGVWAIYLLALVAFEVVADVLAKHFALNGKLVVGV